MRINLTHQASVRADRVKFLLVLRSKGKTYNELENHLRAKNLSDPTIRSYLKTVKALESNPSKLKQFFR